MKNKNNYSLIAAGLLASAIACAAGNNSLQSGLVIVTAAEPVDEPVFNALDSADPHYLDYRQALCKLTLEDIMIVNELQTDAMVRQALIEQWELDFKENCL